MKLRVIGFMIATLGGLFDGWVLYLDHGKSTFHYNFAELAHYNIESPTPLAAEGTAKTGSSFIGVGERSGFLPDL